MHVVTLPDWIMMAIEKVLDSIHQAGCSIAWFVRKYPHLLRVQIWIKPKPRENQMFNLGGLRIAKP